MMTYDCLCIGYASLTKQARTKGRINYPLFTSIVNVDLRILENDICFRVKLRELGQIKPAKDRIL